MVNYNEYVYPTILHYGNKRIRLQNSELNEYFKFTINSGNNRLFQLPLCGGYYRADMQDYDLLVDWGDGSVENIFGTSHQNTHRVHFFPSANTNYQITLRPNGDVDGWGGAFGYCDTFSATTNTGTIISLDSPLTKSMIMKETSTLNICIMMFFNCTDLTLGSDFSLPQDITTVGFGFCNNMFFNCTSITTGVQKFFGNLVLSQEQLDQTSIFNGTFYGCTSITEECSADTIPQLSVIPSSNNYCFTGASDIAREKCPVNWGGELS